MIQLPILKMKQWKCFIEVKTFYQIHEKISFSKTFEKWCTTDEGIALQMRWVLFLLVSGSLMISDFGDSYRIDRACELVNTISVFSKTTALWVKSGNRGNWKCLKVNTHFALIFYWTFFIIFLSDAKLPKVCDWFLG